MSHFDRAIVDVLKHEGGYICHPADPGGETNYGISKRAYPHLDIKNLSRPAAIIIYHRDYWREEYEQFPYRIAAKVFDMAVNMGHRAAHKVLQRAIGAVADGIIGPRTIALINGMDEQAVLNNISEEQEYHYKAIIAAKPYTALFTSGWMKRAHWQPAEVA